MNKVLMPRPKTTNPTIDAYVAAVQKGLESYFVVKNGRGWYVRKASSKTKGTFFENKAQALASAKTKAAKKSSEVLVFNNGNLIDRFSG